ncbi:MAG TPA: EamA family transporter [Terracidiphilus sp.]|nr:EamA family transporter [Terracidiphilus sp.]
MAAATITAIVMFSCTGEVIMSAAMKSLGDLDKIRARRGLAGVLRAVLTCPLFFAGLAFLTLAFFALLFALNRMPLGLVAPVSASLPLVVNAVAAKFFLKENVDHRRWAAAVLVCIGVYLMAH